MKDIIIKGRDLLRELWILLACLLISYGVNVYAILRFDRPASEYYMTLGYVVTLAVGLYLAQLIVRLLVRLIWKLISTICKSINKKKKI